MVTNRYAGLAFVLLCSSGFSVAQVPNFRVSSPAASAPEEVTIAINPANPANLVAGANINYFYSSTDGGLTWSEGQMVSPYGVWGDPCVIFDGKGNGYYAHLSRPPADSGYFLDRLVVHRSTDGGLSWSPGVGVGRNPPVRQQDKEWLGVDLTGSQFHDNLYMAWTQFDEYGSTNPADSSRILFARSTDAGLSWSAPVNVSDQAGDCADSDSTVEGAVPAVGPNGEVFLSWGGPLGIMFDKSVDGGMTWGKDVKAADMPGGWDFDVSGIYRANGMPITACDVSTSPHRGTIYIGWSDQRNGPADTDVFLTRSVDGGLTWSAPQRVNNDLSGRDQFFTWMTVDPQTGALWFVFYDRRATAGDSTEVWCARSDDGGATFSNFRVSETGFVPVKSVFFGDYICISARGGVAHPIWMRMDNRALSVWTARVVDSTAVSVAEGGTGGIPGAFQLEQNWPNPWNPVTTIGYTVGGIGDRGPGIRNVKLTIYNVLGQEVAVLVNEKQVPGRYQVRFDGSKLASGVYLYRLQAGNYVETKHMVLLR